ncbi:MAG: MFS transporter, partial [Chloroflexi bacterium]|nr:MFS transporter [Chloroflexota bacterium]
LGAAMAAPMTGAVLDRWGGRWVVVGASLGMCACALILSQMTQLWQLLLFYGIGRALAVGAMSPAAVVAISNWFIRRRATVSGIVAVGPRLGMATFPMVVALVIDVSGSWRAGGVALALIALVVALPSLLFMRRRPEDVGLLPDGDAAPDDLDALPAVVERDFTVREAVRTRGYWIVGGAMSLVMFCGGAVNFHQIPHLVDQGLPRTEAAFIVTIFSGTGAVGAILGGMLASRISVRWTMVISLAGMGAGILLLRNAATFQAGMIYGLAYGVFFGSQIAMEQVVYADYFGRRALGRIRGSFQPVLLAVNAAGPYLVGVWYDQTGSYGAAFLAFSVMFSLASLAMVFARYPAQPSRPTAEPMPGVAIGTS